MNFIEEWSRKHIINARTLATCLPVRFESKEDQNVMELEVDQKMKSLSGAEVFRVVHRSVELCLEL